MKAQTIVILMTFAATLAHSQGTLQITFDGPPAQPPGSSFSVQNYIESGMLFTAIGPQGSFSRVGVGYVGDAQSGTPYLRAALTQSLAFGFTNGSTFSLASVELAEYSTLFQTPLTVLFTGHKEDGSTVFASFTTDGIIDGTGPLADFETFHFGPEFSGLTRVEIPTYGWSLDDLVVVVPEPAPLLLTAAGGLLLWGLRRRER